jgi:hemolysin activation/secretion protein
MLARTSASVQDLKPICAAALMFCGAAFAQTAPDAGSLLQQIEQQRRVPLPAKAEPLPAPKPMTAPADGASVTVGAFTFAGNTQLTAAQLAPTVAGFLNRPLSFGQLQDAAAAAATAYRQAGWVVRVYLPQQDITGGTVTIQVVEAVFGSVRVDGAPRRIAAAQLGAIVAAVQPAGALVSADALDRALLLIGDLPGIRAQGALSEGQAQAETDLVLEVNDGPLFGGDLTVDNTGSRSTGRGRISANLNIDSPLGRGDQGNALLLHTQGSDYGRAAYALPLGSTGLRGGVNASHLSYKVVTSDFAALDAKGTSTTLGLDASYPLLRSRTRNLYLAATLDDKRFDNQSAGVTSTRYKISTLGLGLNGNLFDDLGGGGANSASLQLQQGRVDLHGSPNEAADAATTHTAGSYGKLRLAAARQQVLSETLSATASVAAQRASNNLDSSEKFYLGGPGGVRAYPASEGGGSEGELLNIELRARLPGNFSVSGFYDRGSVRVNKNNDIAGALALNNYALQGVGVSVGWVASFGLNVKATLARRLGHNPNPTASGNDQDGTLDKNRLWLQASLPF